MASLYRADHVGSLLRPPELLQAREDFTQHRLSAEQLRQAEDAAVLKALDLQREVGIDVFTEGEYRRAGWSTAIRDAVEGLVPTAGSPIQGFLGQWQGPHGDLATATMTAGTVSGMRAPKPSFSSSTRRGRGRSPCPARCQGLASCSRPA
jgi:5-methyltetrahydropteroyltriglutamate--homocysteine methyltransferase